MKMELLETFVVIEDNAIIAQDVAESIKEYTASAKILVRSRKGGDDLKPLQGSRISAFLVSMSPQDILTSGLDKVAEECGAVLVVLHEKDRDAAETPQDWHYLPRPFSTSQIHQVLSDLGVTKTDRAQ